MANFLRRIRFRSITTPLGGAGIEVLPDNEKRAVEQGNCCRLASPTALD
jgi:hypothetical protein